MDAIRKVLITESRFKYGIPVHIKDFSLESGTGMVLTTLQGWLRVVGYLPASSTARRSGTN
jgi:hypothetical protein